MSNSQITNQTNICASRAELTLQLFFLTRRIVRRRTQRNVYECQHAENDLMVVRDVHNPTGSPLAETRNYLFLVLQPHSCQHCLLEETYPVFHAH